MKTVVDSVTCNKCEERFEFDDDGTTQCMPDGYFRGSDWYCDECGEILGLS